MCNEEEFDWSAAIQLWVKGEPQDGNGNDRLLEELWNRTTKLAATVLSNGNSHSMEAGDLAAEFLLELREQGNVFWNSGQGVKRGLFRYLMVHHRKAQYEVMEIARSALSGLERQGIILRDGIGNGAEGRIVRVTNQDRWLHRDCQANGVGFQDAEGRVSIEIASRVVWRRMVRAGEIQRRDGGRLFQPQTAETFLERVLLHISTSATTADLHSGMCLVIAALDFEELTPPPTEDENPRPAADYYRGWLIQDRVYEFLDFEADKRGTELGQILCEDDLCHVFTTYTLVENATLAGTGLSPQTAHDRAKQIEKCIRSVLPADLQLEIAEDALDRAGNIGTSDDKDQVQRFRVLFSVKALNNAGEFCRKNCQSSPSKRGKASQGKHSP